VIATIFKAGQLAWTMNRIIGFLASKWTGFTPSSTPPCGGALGTAVDEAAADYEAIDDMVNGC
jgi:hypothetical protein